MNDDPFARERFARRQRSPFLGRQAFVPTPEDVVVMKLRWALSLNRQEPFVAFGDANWTDHMVCRLGFESTLRP